MQINLLKPKQSLNKAYLKEKVSRSAIDLFKKNFSVFLDHTNSNKGDEEHLKSQVMFFLRDTWFKDTHHINPIGKNDLVIHNGKSTSDTAGVIVEVKSITNKAEMLTEDKPNAKALHELVLYYLRERIDHNNNKIKYLVATNIEDWYIFDANEFDKKIFRNTDVKRLYELKKTDNKDNPFFYEELRKLLDQQADLTIEATHFQIRAFEHIVSNEDARDDNKLIAIYKLLSPAHLLKLSFANDSNSLQPKFYSELLHLIGLVEVKEGSKKLIQRKKEGSRDCGSLLESTIIQLDSHDKLSRIDKPSRYGETKGERLYAVALELVITWVNRILFLKLLEAQLLSYHKGDRAYTFLNREKIKDFDDLDKLFFRVLAKLPEERTHDIQKLFGRVPYLNSSLFEPTELEHQTLFINGLEDYVQLPIIGATVLKDENGKTFKGSLVALDYLFGFLDAYDFSSEGAEDIQEDNKTLINASVLGLIFEKINGYKDGSFFTPGFITMYMCRETIRRSVVQKFNEVKGWDCKELTDLYNKIEDNKEANTIINSLKICDPAVGSGHFLVSALNEIIAIKADLNILLDREGRRLKEYQVEVVNDELAITDEDGSPFSYNPDSKESQRVQEALFHEKQTIIENCLFGVDINLNSVKICRLRLWIELLKNAYYRPHPSLSFGDGPGVRHLETLPNIDINIKTGNSLISRFALDADLKKALKKSKFGANGIDSYRFAVKTYQNARNKEEKREMEQLIHAIKSDFRTEIANYDPRKIRIAKLEEEVFILSGKYRGGFGMMLFEDAKDYKSESGKQRNEKIEKKLKEISKLNASLEDDKNNIIYENAFEWRFEFPQVLNNEGDFVGFDVVIGNPPYIRQEEFSTEKPYYRDNYTSFSGTADLYVYFVELGLNVLKDQGSFTFILPNKWMRSGYGKSIRKLIKKNRIDKIIDFGDLPVFEEATTYPCILTLNKSIPVDSFKVVNVQSLNFSSGIINYLQKNEIVVLTSGLAEGGWALSESSVQKTMSKILTNSISLTNFTNNEIYRGVLTGFNKAFVIDEHTRDRLIEEDYKSIDIIKPFLAGRDIKRYHQPKSSRYLIFTKRGIDINNYPAILKHLEKFKENLQPKPKDYKGKDWIGRKPGNYKWYEIQDTVEYFQKFEKPKILWPGITDIINSFAYDQKGLYGNDNNHLIISEDKSILALLNSNVSKFFLKNTCDFVRGGFIRLKISYVSQFPVPKGLRAYKDILSEKVNTILLNKGIKEDLDTSEIETEIDQLVYQLYGLTEEEIKIVEG